MQQYPQQPPTQMSVRKRKWYKWPLSIVIVTVSLLGLLWLVGSNLHVLPGDSCTVGIVGYNVSVTFSESTNAGSNCDLMVKDYPQEYYASSESPSGSILCEGDLNHEYYSENPPLQYYIYNLPAGLYDTHYKVMASDESIAIAQRICYDLIGPSSN